MRWPATADNFVELMLIWVALAGIVVFPMAVVSGYQFPLFIGLVGARAENVGAQVGRVYALNTMGAIAGSLAGGFGILPGIGALGAWRLAAVSLGLLGIGGACISWSRGEWRGWPAAAVIVSILAVPLCLAQGPTAVWRHRPIGVIGMSAILGESANDERKYLHEVRRGVFWAEDGIESTVAVTDEDGFSLMINGKSDGNAVGDVSTMIMLGGLPAIFHDGPKRILIVGLGLGTTAGWLATVPSVETVDVIELEPAVLRAAKEGTTTNFRVMTNPKVRIVVGDAREFLLTTKSRYDIIVSEPSNPYRAGVASLFTVEFYEAAKAALAPGGVFAQWLQAYSVNLPIVRTVYATVATVFDSVETWEVHLADDLILLAREHDVAHDVQRLRARIETEPYRAGLALAWGVAGIEGLYSGFLANAVMAREIRASEPSSRLNTDDRTLIEFECARSILYPNKRLMSELHQLAQRRIEFAPPLTNGEIDAADVAEARVARAIHENRGFRIEGFPGNADGLARMQAREAYASQKFDDVRSAWARQQSPPIHPIDTVMLAEALANGGDPTALVLSEKLRRTSPGDVEAIAAFYHYARGDLVAATTALVNAFEQYRVIPWGHPPLRVRAIYLAWPLARTREESVPPLLDALKQPFAVHVAQERRFLTYVAIASDKGLKERCSEALESIEPWVPWEEGYLRARLKCYEQSDSPYLRRASDDIVEFLAAAG
jgi:spermidine synthase